MQQQTTTIDQSFYPDNASSRNIKGVAEIFAYKNNSGVFGANIKPGLAFPGFSKLFNVKSLNRRIHLACLLCERLENTKIVDIGIVSDGHLLTPDGSITSYKVAKYTLLKGKKQKTIEAFVASAGQQVIILASENKIDLNLAKAFSQKVQF